jgi:hypothetical protein
MYFFDLKYFFGDDSNRAFNKGNLKTGRFNLLKAHMSTHLRKFPEFKRPSTKILRIGSENQIGKPNLNGPK